MSHVKLQTRDGRIRFEPGEEIEVLAEWNLDDRPERIEIRLVWYTQGKGDRDWKLVDTIAFDGPSVSESRQGRFRLPDSPYSFSGKLISLVWAIEVVVEPIGLSSRIDVTVAPGGREVLLQGEPSGGAG